MRSITEQLFKFEGGRAGTKIFCWYLFNECAPRFPNFCLTMSTFCTLVLETGRTALKVTTWKTKGIHKVTKKSFIFIKKIFTYFSQNNLTRSYLSVCHVFYFYSKRYLLTTNITWERGINWYRQGPWFAATNSDWFFSILPQRYLKEKGIFICV